MEIQTIWDEGFPVVTISGRFTGISCSDALCASVDAALAHPGPGAILDFGGAQFVSSSGLRAVAIAVNTARKARMRIVVVVSTQMIRDVFSMSGFDQIFDIVDSREAAREHLAS